MTHVLTVLSKEPAIDTATVEDMVAWQDAQLVVIYKVLEADDALQLARRRECVAAQPLAAL